MNTLLRSEFFKILGRMMIVAFAGLCAMQAGASIILVSKGVIATGTDTTGVFGAGASDLAGKPYKMTITYDDFSTAFHSSSATFDKQTGPMTGVVGVAVAGKSFTTNVTRSFGAMLYVNNNGTFSEVTGFQSGNDAQGQDVYASHDLSSTSGTVTGPAIGMTSYTAMAGDIGHVTFTTSGSAGAASFTASPTGSWLVFAPDQLINALIAYVTGVGLDHGIQTSLLTKLTSALAYLASGDTTAATQKIDDFINEVHAQSGKHIPSSQAAEMTSQAQAVIDAIGILFG